MYSLQYYLARTRGIRKILKVINQAKIRSFKKSEDQKLLQDPKNLRNFEEKVFSQNGEDGIIAEIFNRIGVTNKFFVEFGFENGSECNGKNLVLQGWSGLWIDGNEKSIQEAVEKFKDYSVKIFHRFITKENIEHTFKEAEVPVELDLLSIDIDGNDYWIWQQLKNYRARVVVIEYNAKFIPPVKWVMPYNPHHTFDGTSYFGASLQSLTELGNQMGYKLVVCDSMGVNAFFVREDLAQNKFTHLDGGSDYHYCAPKYRALFFGHPSGAGRWM